MRLKPGGTICAAAGGRGAENREADGELPRGWGRRRRSLTLPPGCPVWPYLPAVAIKQFLLGDHSHQGGHAGTGGGQPAHRKPAALRSSVGGWRAAGVRTSARAALPACTLPMCITAHTALGCPPQAAPAAPACTIASCSAMRVVALPATLRSSAMRRGAAGRLLDCSASSTAPNCSVHVERMGRPHQEAHPPPTPPTHPPHPDRGTGSCAAGGTP